MRTLNFIPAVLLMGMMSCNNSSDKATATTDTAAAKSQDTMTMNHAADSSKMVTPLPDVPAGARVYFKNLKEGATVSSPVKVEMGVEGIKLDTAGNVIAGVGHHHLLVDAEDSLSAGTVIPKDATHLHFGKAQSSAELTLAPGKHKLVMQYGDGIHRSYGGKLSAVVNITVK